MRPLEGIEWGREEGFSWLMTPGRKDGTNCIYEVNLAPERAEAGIDGIIARFREKGLYPAWWIGPSARPRDLDRLLRAREFRVLETDTGMALELDRRLPGAALREGLRLIRIEDPRRLLEVLEIFGPGVGLSPLEYRQEHAALVNLGLGPGQPFQHFAGLLGEELVSSTSFFRMGETAVLDYVSSSPAHRGKGFAKAVFAAALKEARERGCRRAVLLATEMGRPFYRSLGFQELCAVSIWSYRPASQVD